MKRKPPLPRVYGALIVPQRKAIAGRYGEEAVQRALARVKPAMRTEYESITADLWCSGETMDVVMRAIAEEVEVTPAELVDGSVSDAIKGTVGKRWWRPLLRITNDYSLLARVPMFYARSYDRGSLVGERTGPGRASLVLEGWTTVPELHAVAMAAAVRAVLEVAGRKEVRATFRPDGACGLIDVSWKV